jgi:hypothetical protein
MFELFNINFVKPNTIHEVYLTKHNIKMIYNFITSMARKNFIIPLEEFICTSLIKGI